MVRKKTSISIDENLWRKFCSINILKHGNRKNSEILEELIKEYIQNKES